MPKASFDTWTLIFLFATLQGLFVSAVLLVSKEKHPTKYILASIIFIFSIILLEYVLFWTRYQFYYPYLITLSIPLVFCFGPLFYLYSKSAFTSKPLAIKDLIHFAPFAVALLFFAPFILKSVSEKQAILIKNAGSIGDPNVSSFFVWLGILSMVAYSVAIYREFEKLAKSNPAVNKWFTIIWWFFVGFTGSYMSYYILCNFSFFNPAWDYTISFFMTFFIYLIAWAGYRQPQLFNGFGWTEESKTKYKNSPVSGDIGKEIVDQLNAKMESEKYFMKPDLSLDKLSQLMDLNKHYLSQAINENLKMNFFEYINSLRIKEAQCLLLKPENETVLEVAYQVGFNNKVSFNKAFKNITGLTPTEYKKQVKLVKPEQN